MPITRDLKKRYPKIGMLLEKFDKPSNPNFIFNVPMPSIILATSKISLLG